MRVPTLLVGGELTQTAFTDVLDGLARAMPDARRVTIPGVGHTMSRDNPQAFNAALLGFLSPAA